MTDLASEPVCRLEAVSDKLAMFPLNTVLFPGVTLSLHVFEDRYRALVHHLLTISSKPARVFGVVAIREGYEVGAHGAQSLHRVGCVAQMTSVDAHSDGQFDIEIVGRQRLRLESLDTSAPYLTGSVELLQEGEAAVGGRGADEARRQAGDTLATFATYRERLARMQGRDLLAGDIPEDPLYLSFALSATCPLTLQERQALLECDTPQERLALLRVAMREEMRAMRAVPSLPATEVARTRWSPN